MSLLQNNQGDNNNNNNYRQSRRNSAQGSRREWVQRGSDISETSRGTANTATTTESSVVRSTNLNLNEFNRQRNWNRDIQEPRGRGSPYINQRREGYKGKDRVAGKNKHEQVKTTKENDPNLPQLAQEIQEKLMKGTVECMICYDMVRRSAPIWSCKSCFSLFHLNCIKKWAKAPTSVDLSTEKSHGFNWRCPGCQFVQLTSSKEIRYICFCGKRHDPPSDLYLTPHSCGEPCGKPLEKEILRPGMIKEDLCPHACVLQCHPGPCPPCKVFAPPRSCPCGKNVITTRCYDHESVLTCGESCDKLLDCGRHRCERTCHVGSCDPCQVSVNASCFCTKKTEAILCGDMAVKGEVKLEDGVFSCNFICEGKLSCGNHICRETCHPGPCGECNFLPNKIKTCCCGKTTLKEERQSCLNPIPTCSQICEKILPCTLHHCQEVCHSGDCAPCLVPVTQKCRCGSSSRTIQCFKTSTEYEDFTCDKPCGRKKNCGRHRCNERCCSLGDHDPHICSMHCGKKLRCGQHSCDSQCHMGHCPPCLATIFTDMTCACGRTSIPPPLPCGTPPPSCQHPCSVPQACGHPPTHSCHFGDCPPCSVPVAKECVGGHVVLRSILCGSKDVRCNNLCGKTRRCGLHACARTCHPLSCDSSGEGKGSCGQACGFPRRDCKHSCTTLCHPGDPCPDTECESLVTITCSCGRIAAKVPCHEKGQRKLMCDIECEKMERKKVLANAFGVTPSNSDSPTLSDLLRRDPKWVLSVEERCKILVLGKARGGVNALKVHVFCPMLKEKGDAVRLIAERWNLSVNIAGWEPKRFVVLHVTPKSRPPTRVLGVDTLQLPIYDSLVDMDPGLVVSLFNLPRDGDISALVLRFGGECELVWLDQKNAVAVFSDHGRALNALRRLDQGSVYYGASVVPQNTSISGTSSGGSAWGVNGNSLKKAEERESSWGDEDWNGKAVGMEPSAWKRKEPPIPTSENRWSVLNSETATLLIAPSTEKQQDLQPEVKIDEISDVVDDWETHLQLKEDV